MLTMKQTLKDLLIERAGEHPEKVFLFWEDETFTYGQLLEKARQIASGLLKKGLQKGDNVCIFASNRPEYIFTIFGCAFSGTVLTPINTQFKSEEAKYIINNCEAKILVTQPEFMKVIEKIRPECETLKEVIMLDDFIPDTTSFKDLYDDTDLLEQEVEENDSACIIYTSGTTGHPKGVILTHHNYMVNSDQIVKWTRMTEEDRFMCILPLFHVNGQVVTVIAPLYAGASMLLVSRFSPKDFLPKLEQFEISSFSAVPTIYAILNNLPDAEDYNLSKLRFCICGAAPMPVRLINSFERKYSAFILEGYGLSEATCVCSINPLDNKRKVGSIGFPLPGQEIRIVDKNDEDMESGQVGEIIIKGENVMKGYYNDPEATKETLKNGWLHTGDLGYQDKNGYLFIEGRKKDMIIRGGENIYPREIEEVIAQHSQVKETAVVGIPDKIWGEEVAAFIVTQNGETIRESEIMSFCDDKLANYKCPRMVFFWDDLPKTLAGEILKSGILEKHLNKGK